jgi:hypothetical protein
MRKVSRNTVGLFLILLLCLFFAYRASNDGTAVAQEPLKYKTTGIAVYNCGTGAACVPAHDTRDKIVIGNVTLSSGLGTVTSLPFADTSYRCAFGDRTTAYAIYAVNSNATTLSIYTETSSSDKIDYICIGK